MVPPGSDGMIMTAGPSYIPYWGSGPEASASPASWMIRPCLPSGRLTSEIFFFPISNHTSSQNCQKEVILPRNKPNPSTYHLDLICRRPFGAKWNICSSSPTQMLYCNCVTVTLLVVLVVAAATKGAIKITVELIG